MAAAQLLGSILGGSASSPDPAVTSGIGETGIHGSGAFTVANAPISDADGFDIMSVLIGVTLTLLAVIVVAVVGKR